MSEDRPSDFVWDVEKEWLNILKHGVDFRAAMRAFLDPEAKIDVDGPHSSSAEQRFFCYGKVDEQVLTVRFTYRDGKIRIFGAGYWRRGGRRYENKTE